MLFIGIDPGASGAIATLHKVGKGLKLNLFPFQKLTPLGISDLCYALKTRGKLMGGSVVFIEQVGGFMGGFGRNQASAHTMFNFGHQTGFIEGCCISHGLKVVKVLPKIWQQFFFGRDQPKDKPTRKKMYRDVAQNLFPKSKGINLQTCDAILICLHAMRKHNKGRIQPVE